MAANGNLDARVRSIVDDRLFSAFWSAVQHFKTRDLVLIFDTSLKVDPVTALPRSRLADDPNSPLVFRQKLVKPAVEAATELTDSETAFWLVAFFSDEETAIVAVNAKLLAPGGHA